MAQSKTRPVIPSEARNLSYSVTWAGMKFIFVSALFLLAFSLSAQAPQPVPLAQGGQPGEPHHHLKIENEYVRAYYVEVPPHDSTQLHQHDHDYLFVTLGDSDVMNAVQNKPEVHLVLKDGEVHFTRGGFAHVARNLSDKPFRNVTIELLKPQGDARNLCAQIIASDPLGPCDKPANDHGMEAQFDTAEVRVDLIRFSSRTTNLDSAMKAPVLIVGLKDSRIEITTKGKAAKTLRQGEIAWFNAGSQVEFSNIKGETAAFLQITFIDSVTGAKK
jgi:quercetin dioxygenase-like cupin family protein